MKVDGRDDGTMVTTGSSVELFTSPAELSEVIRDEAAAPAMDGRTRPVSHRTTARQTPRTRDLWTTDPVTGGCETVDLVRILGTNEQRPGG